MFSFNDNFFYIPENKKVIDILAPYNMDDWRKSNLIKFGGNDTLKVKVKSQHNGDTLYMYFEITDEQLINGDDSITICINSNNKSEPSPENVLLRYELTLDDETGRLFYFECNNDEYNWGEQLPVPDYIECNVNKDSFHSIWTAAIKIDFACLKLYGINPQSFGLYIKVLDFKGVGSPLNHYWPVTAMEKRKDPYYIPPYEQWAIGRFVAELRKPRPRRPRLLKISKFINSRLTFSANFNTLSYLVFRRKLRYKMM